MWQLVDNLPPSVLEMEGDINCHVEEEDTATLRVGDAAQANESINVSTQVTVEISNDKEVEFNEKFNIVFPTIKGQCLNTKDFKLVKNRLVAEIEQSLNPTNVINNFLDNYSDIINSSQEKLLSSLVEEHSSPKNEEQLAEIISSG